MRSSFDLHTGWSYWIGITAIIMLHVTGTAVHGQWVMPPGEGWVQVSLYHHDTTNRFDEERNIEPLFNQDGRSVTTSLIITGVVGVFKGVDLWGQAPVHRSSFNDISADRESFGLGDPRLHIRVGPELLGFSNSFPVALRGGVKLAIGDFPIDSEIVPLTEGQTDWELILEVGHSFYPSPIYTLGWVGYRWRETNKDIERKPGDELFAYAAIGAEYEKWVWKLAIESQWGEQWESFTGTRILLANSERELVHVQPTVGWRLWKGVIEVGSRLPIVGRNFPAGPAFFIGYFHTWK